MYEVKKGLETRNIICGMQMLEYMLLIILFELLIVICILNIEIVSMYVYVLFVQPDMHLPIKLIRTHPPAHH